jgi:hypothetical protein
MKVDPVPRSVSIIAKDAVAGGRATMGVSGLGMTTTSTMPIRAGTG